MKTRAELMAEMKTIIAEIETLESADTVDAEAVEAKRADWEKLEGKVKQMDVSAKRKAEMDRLEAEGKTLYPASPAMNAAQPAKPRESVEKDHIDAVASYMQGKRLSDKQIDTFGNKKGIRLPESMVYAILGKRFAQAMGKALPVTSSDISATIVPTYGDGILQLPPEPPRLYDMVRIVPAGGGKIYWPRAVQTDASEYGGIVVDDSSEGAAKNDTEPDIEQVEIDCTEISAYTELSDTLLRRDSYGIAAFVSQMFAGALRSEIESRIMTGTGDILGVLNTTDIRLVVRAAANQVSRADLVGLKYALRWNHRANSMFIVADDAAEYLENLEDNDGRPLFAVSAAEGIFDRLAGRPAVTTHRLSLGDDGDVMLLDPREYILAVDADITIQSSTDYQFKKNVTAYRAFVNVGGQLVQPRSAAILALSSS